MVRKQLTDENGKIREGIREQWRVFAACKTKKGLTFAEDTPVLVQVCQLRNRNKSIGDSWTINSIDSRRELCHTGS